MAWLADDIDVIDGLPSIEELEEGMEQVEVMLGMLASTATGGVSDPRAYLRNRRRLNKLLKRAGIRSPFYWNTLDEWREYSKTEFPRDYAGRRAFVNKITREVRDALQERLDEATCGDLLSEFGEFGELADDVLKDPSGIRVELDRLPGLLRTDLGGAVGKAKNLVEATAKAVLAAQGRNAPEHSFDKSVNAALRALDLNPDPSGRSPEAEAMRLLKQLTAYVGALRNNFGDGHGAVQAHTAVEARHARLAVRAALSWCYFALEALRDQNVD
ncbi:abortive infection family protein [Micromonospora marina]|uniref:abortive infection family protein n=1 Tax=Micromonospora marina TaxID=307120 RepID=UPI003D75789A